MKLLGVHLVAMLGTGCIPALQQEPVNSAPYAAPDAHRETERRRAPTVQSDVYEDGTLKLTVSERHECRDATPMVRDVGTRRHLAGGALSYVVNGVGAVALGGIGVGLAVAPCNGCTPDQTKNVQLTGGVLAALALVPIGLMVWNAVRSSDDVTTAPVTDARPEWTACGSKLRPFADGTSVRLQFADGTAIDGRLDDNGYVGFDLSSVALADAALSSGSAKVIVNGVPALNPLSIQALPQYQAWKAQRDQEAAAAQARQAAASRAAIQETHRCSFSAGDGSCLDRCDSAYASCQSEIGTTWVQCGYRVADCIHACGCQTSHAQ